MSVFKCKMCGGTLEVREGATVCECEYCGTRQTISASSDETIRSLFNRANSLRMRAEFDKAGDLYEKILQLDSTEAEAYWGLILCKYGVEYVEDPKTLKRIPTCHRTSFDAVMADDDYKNAIYYASADQKGVYEAEAKAIDEIQKGILSISGKEDPYDVFICYKETDENGKRTKDSVIANDIYYQLTQQGFKVFYAAITLEDKLGAEYEPYIFSALNSSKVMLALGTRPEYFNAVWVKNEWSRFLQLMKKDRSKLLIPCYRDMDAYELPEEFAHLQAQDMSKIGFINDIVRGIKKVIVKDDNKPVAKETAAAVSAASGVAPLLKRAFMFLEDGNWQEADNYCEKVLDQDPENAQAYLGKLMASLRVSHQEDLKDCEQPFDGLDYYRKTLRFADDKLSAELKGFVEYIKNRNENARQQGIYDEAKSILDAEGKAEIDYKKAESLFLSISSFKNSTSLAKDAADKAEIARKDALLAEGQALVSQNTITQYRTAINVFKTIPRWKNADELISVCQKQIEELKAKEEEDRIAAERKAEADRIAADIAAKKRKKTLSIVLPTVAVLAVFAAIIIKVIIPNNNYNKAVQLYENGKYEEAIEAFEAMNGYKDSEDQIAKCKESILELDYQKAIRLYNEKEYALALELFSANTDYKDSLDYIQKCESSILEEKYQMALQYQTNREFERAINEFESLNGYKDSNDQIAACKYGMASDLQSSNQLFDAASLFYSIDYEDSKDRSWNIWEQLTQRKTIACGYHHTVAIKTDGTVVATGRNNDGQCDVSEWNNIICVAAGDSYTLGLKSDGTVVATGDNNKGQCNVSFWKDIVNIYAHGSFSIGLKADGTLVKTGQTSKTDEGKGDIDDWSDIIDVSIGSFNVMGLRSDRTVVVSRKDGFGSWEKLNGKGGVIGVNAALYIYAINTDYSVSTSDPDIQGWTDIKKIDGSSTVYGLKKDGTIVVKLAVLHDKWEEKPTKWKDIIDIDYNGHIVGLTKNGTMLAAGDNEYGECNVSAWRNIMLPNK